MKVCDGCRCVLRGIDEVLVHLVEFPDGSTELLCDDCYDAWSDASEGEGRA